MSTKVCFVVLEHSREKCSEDLIRSIRQACPSADIVWYDSGDVGGPELFPGVPRLPASRTRKWGKLTPFFFDMLSWAATTDYDYYVYAESDMLFCGTGFQEFVATAMAGFDYMAPYLRFRTPRGFHWKPYTSLQAELPELLSILGMSHTNRCFTPGQVFSARYVDRVTSSIIYDELLRFVERNQEEGRSRSLQEVLLPTLVDRFDLIAREYPRQGQRFNRWRPHLTEHEMGAALADPEVPFAHPIHRDERDGARTAWRTRLGAAP